MVYKLKVLNLDLFISFDQFCNKAVQFLIKKYFYTMAFILN